MDKIVSLKFTYSEKDFSQMGQEKGFSPVCDIVCLFRVPSTEKALLHCVHTYGFFLYATKATWFYKKFVANGTSRFLSYVLSMGFTHVYLQYIIVTESFSTIFTEDSHLTCVHVLVNIPTAGCCEIFCTQRTAKGFLSCMHCHVSYHGSFCC